MSLKNNQYMVVLSIILLGLLFSCNRENKTDVLTENKTGALTWTLNDGILTISGKGPIPNGGGPWYNLDDGYPDITAIIINDGVTNIGNYAFANHKKVMYVSIPGSVTDIGEYAFKGCSSITSIIIPDGVINIDNYAFENCINLISVNIPDSVLNIGDFAFWSLTAPRQAASLKQNQHTVAPVTATVCYNRREGFSLSSVRRRSDIIPHYTLTQERGIFSLCYLKTINTSHNEPKVRRHGLSCGQLHGGHGEIR